MANVASGVDPTGLLGAAKLLARPAEEFVNDSGVETLWAIKAADHMEVYFNLLKSLDPKILRLTPVDEVIFQDFQQTFKSDEIDIAKLNEDTLKTEESKAKWRDFCNRYTRIIEDFNYATILRLDSSGDYSPENTTLVPRAQFYAIEILRNRKGLNDCIREKFGKKKAEESGEKNVEEKQKTS